MTSIWLQSVNSISWLDVHAYIFGWQSRLADRMLVIRVNEICVLMTI
jgi:hypothetical protein